MLLSIDASSRAWLEKDTPLRNNYKKNDAPVTKIQQSSF
jgi:hypothetical protein